MRSKEIKLTQEELKRVFDYNAYTGLFYWKEVTVINQIKVGSLAGTIDKKGYRVIKYNNTLYKAHRLAWLYIHGNEPDKFIDHIDGDRSNNIISNLRLCSNSQNGMNVSKQINNTSGYKGVSWNRRLQKWRAYITIDRKQIHLGYFDTRELAAIRYEEVAKERHGDFYKDTSSLIVVK